MTGMLRVCLCVLGGLVAGQGIAASPELLSFGHKDWELQCDNTHACRVAGYQSEEGDSEPVSLLVTRPAGPGAPVDIELSVYHEEPLAGPLELKVGSIVLSGLQGDPARIPARHVPELVKALLKAETASVRAGEQEWTLSLAGAAAVLLKMDEAQGRIGTTGALVRRGKRTEATVKASSPPPVVKAVKPLPTSAEDKALAQPVFQSLSAADQEAMREQCSQTETPTVWRLDQQTLLLEVPCLMGAYNASSLLWIAHDRPPYQPRALEEIDGEFDPETGAVTRVMKGRGLGDCWSSDQWHYDGQGFTPTGQRHTGMCRGFAGGAWELPTLVTKVVIVE